MKPLQFRLPWRLSMIKWLPVIKSEITCWIRPSQPVNPELIIYEIHFNGRLVAHIAQHPKEQWYQLDGMPLSSEVLEYMGIKINDFRNLMGQIIRFSRPAAVTAKQSQFVA